MSRTGRPIASSRRRSSSSGSASSFVSRSILPSRQLKQAVYTCWQRASITAQTAPEKGSPSARRAIAARVETPIQGLSCAKASPLTAATPIRTPVNEPGPLAIASASISSSVSAASSSIWPIMGISVWLWVRRTCTEDEAKISPFSVTAQEAGPAEHSTANNFMMWDSSCRQW